MSSSLSLVDVALFEEPEDFRPPPPPKHLVDYTRALAPTSIHLLLLGHSPLWGHLLWNLARYTAGYLDSHPELVAGKRVLELGSGLGLPLIIAALHGARVVCTDYPDVDLVSNIRDNVDSVEGIAPGTIPVEGYIWGQDTAPLEALGGGKFDVVVLLDLVFNHTEHTKLLQTCWDSMVPGGVAMVVFLPHRPHLLDKDLAFFQEAADKGFAVERVALEQWEHMHGVDEEPHDVSGRVYHYALRR